MLFSLVEVLVAAEISGRNMISKTTTSCYVRSSDIVTLNN